MYDFTGRVSAQAEEQCAFITIPSTQAQAVAQTIMMPNVLQNWLCTWGVVALSMMSNQSTRRPGFLYSLLPLMNN